MQKSNLTFYIFIALIAGIVAGYLYNVYVINDINTRLSTADANIKVLDSQISGFNDTTSLTYGLLKNQRAAEVRVRNQNNILQSNKLEVFNLLGDIFIRLIKMIVAPLVFTTLVVGVAKVGDVKSVGRIGGKTLLWFLGATLISLAIGMVMVNLFEPGRAIHIPLPDGHVVTGIEKTTLSLADFAGHIVPRSFFEAMANNEILQIVVFSLLFGIGTASIGKMGEVVIKAMDAIAHVILKVTGYVMMLAPLAVFGAITAIIARQGPGILKTYAVFISEFYLSLIILWLVILFGGFLVLNKRVFTLLGYIKDSMLIAFGTSTSEAVYPKLLLELERFGCNNKIVSFVLPLGYSFNLDGGMMYMTFASLFIAQAYNIQLTFLQQIIMLLTLMLSSKGVAGIPRAALVVVAATLAMFNIPEAGLALLIGIDPFLDMGRSATNVLGNAVASAAISKWEGELR